MNEDLVPDEPQTARIAGGYESEYRALFPYLAYVNTLAHNTSEMGEDPIVTACPKCAEIGSCPEDPRDRLGLTEEAREVLR